MELYDVSAELFLYLVTFRRRVRRGNPVDEEEVRSRLTTIFARQQKLADSDTRLAHMYERIRYALVVFADEIVLTSEWEHADSWSQNLLEQKYFDTSIGGERFFEIVDSIHETEGEIAQVLSICLSLGFRGKFPEDSEQLRSYRSRLLRMIPDRMPTDQTKITPEAYHAEEGEPKGSPVVNLVRVAIACGVFVVMYLVVSQLLWHDAVGAIRKMAEALGAGGI